MGLSETGEQPKAAEEKREKKATERRLAGRKKRCTCVKERREAEHLLFHDEIVEEERWQCSFSLQCQDPVADNNYSACTMDGFGMMVNRIDSAK